MSTTTTPGVPTRTARTIGRQPLTLRLAPWAAALWSAATLPWAIGWTLGSATPWDGFAIAPLHGLPRTAIGWMVVVLAVLALAGSGWALCLRGRTRAARRTAAGPARPVHVPLDSRAVGAALIGLGLVVAVVVSDVRALALLGYAPILLANAVLGFLTDPQLSWAALAPHLAALGHAAGGAALIASGVALRRGPVGACRHCGSRCAGPDARQPRSVPVADRAADRAAAWRGGRLAVGLAVAIPVFYASTRVAWALGVPLGVDHQFLDELGDAKWVGLGLGSGAVGGAILTLGLVARWGEVFPRWVPGLRGRRVPVPVAVVPAYAVALAIGSAGTSFLKATIVAGLDPYPGTPADWGAWLPELLWVPWAVALAFSAHAYQQRRRPACTARPGADGGA